MAKAGPNVSSPAPSEEKSPLKKKNTASRWKWLTAGLVGVEFWKANNPTCSRDKGPQVRRDSRETSKNNGGGELAKRNETRSSGCKSSERPSAGERGWTAGQESGRPRVFVAGPKGLCSRLSGSCSPSSAFRLDTEVWEPLSGTPVRGRGGGGGGGEGVRGGGGGGGRSVTLTFQPAAPHKENYQTDAAGWWTYLRRVRCESNSEPSVWRKSNTTMQMFNYSERAAFKMILGGRFINKMHIAVVKCVSHSSMIHKSLYDTRFLPFTWVGYISVYLIYYT